MSKHLSPAAFYNLPSGNDVHPWRLIHKDGTVMWKDALLDRNGFIHIPQLLAHEAHIIKTAQRIEELNSWVSQALEPWDCLKPTIWYRIDHPHTPLAEGYGCFLKHTSIPADEVFDVLKQHVHSHEKLKSTEDIIYFQRC